MAFQHIEDTQSWTALFRPFSSHSLWLSLIQGPRDFFVVLQSTTSEKLFIPYKASDIVQAIMVCPNRCEVCPFVEYLWLDMLRDADES